MVIIPTCFRITPFVYEGKVEDSTWTKEKALRMLDAANRAFGAARAQVKFDPKGEVCVTDEPLKISPGDRLNDERLLQAVANLRPAQTITYVYLVNHIPRNIVQGCTCFNGIPEFVMYFQDSETNDEHKGILLAHEFGHFLNLGEAEEDTACSPIDWATKYAGNLMNSEHARGPKLLQWQIDKIRASSLAETYGGPAPPSAKKIPDTACFVRKH